MEAKKQEPESGSDWNIYIVHEPARFGGPFGVYVDKCVESVFDRIAKPVKILMEIPEKGPLAHKFERAMKDYAVKFAPGWYDIPIDYLLSSLGDVLRDDFERDMCAHYASMMDLE